MASTAVLLLVSLVGVALLLADAQRATEDAANKRFAERAKISAALTESVFTSLGGASSASLVKQFSGKGRALSTALERQRVKAKSVFHLVTDERGRLLGSSSGVPAKVLLADDPSGGDVLSDVMGSGTGRFIEYAIPFQVGGERRRFVQGAPLKGMQSLPGRLPRPAAHHRRGRRPGAHRPSRVHDHAPWQDRLRRPPRRGTGRD